MRTLKLFILAISTIIMTQNLFSQSNSKLTFAQIKIRQGKTYHLKAPFNVTQNSNINYTFQEPSNGTSLQITIQRKVNENFSIGGNLAINNYQFRTHYSHSDPNNNNTLIFTSNYKFVGIGISGLYNFILAKYLSLQLINSYEIDLQDKADNTGNFKLSGDISAQIQIAASEKLKPFIGFYHRRAITNYSKIEEYFPYAYGLLLGLQF